MQDRSRNIRALLNRADQALKDVEVKYQASLHAKKIDPLLRIDIKNLCENLRSVLDYLAQDIRVACQPPAKKKERIYFPIFLDRQDFERLVRRWFPGLAESNPALREYLESVQPFQPPYKWLAQFNDLNNENKHGDLVEQARTERKEIRIRSDSGSIGWDPDSVKFGPGIRVCGASIDPETQQPILNHPSQRVDRMVWVDFQFELRGERISALSLLRTATEQIARIAGDIQEMLGTPGPGRPRQES